MPSDARLRGLYALTPALADTAELAARVSAALEGGAALVQYRAKDASRELALAQARVLRAVCHAHAVRLIVNDSLELALACGADGVHLGRDDISVREARAAFPRGVIGVSCYDDPARALEAARGGADYVGIGSVFDSPTKPGAVRAPLALLATAKEISGLPVVAIGGITTANARLAVDAGADMVAVISSLFGTPDVRAAAREFARAFQFQDQGAHHVRAQPRAV